MKFVILAPAKVVSGGPELAHQLSHELGKNGYDAYMYYAVADYLGPVDAECAEKYKKYNTKRIISHVDADKEDNIVVIPESLADRTSLFKKAKPVLWWMSVDNFFSSNTQTDVNELDKSIHLHLVQSKYAEDFLLRNGINSGKIITVSDYISDAYGQFIFPAEYRKNIVLYNPKKGGDTIAPLIKKANWAEWKPLVGLTEEEMIFVMEVAKVYIDFGNHPGKDRIPREAAVCGCCIVTNMNGSAAFYEDVSIPDKYKIDTEKDYVDIADEVLRDLCNNYASRLADFDEYRNKISSEKSVFASDVQRFIAYVNEKDNDNR